MKFKVAHIISTLETGGAEKLIVDSISIYKLYGVEVDLIVIKKSETSFSKQLQKDVNIISLTEGSIYNPLLIFELIPILRKYKLVHLHLFPVLYWGVLAKLIGSTSTKVVYTEHSTDNRRRHVAFLKFFDRFIYKRIDFICCISAATYKNLLNYLKLKKINACIIENGIILDKFIPYPNRKLNFFSDDAFILTQVSSFRSQKDQATLIKALKLLPLPIKLLLVGEGELRAQCEHLSKELQLNERIKFLGQRTDIVEILNSVDVVVQSSNVEGFGLAIVEGMACKKPAVCSAVPGLKDIVKGYGLLFEKNNHVECAAVIKKLYYNNDYRIEIAENCYKRSKDFDINVMIRKYIQLYCELLGFNK